MAFLAEKINGSGKEMDEQVPRTFESFAEREWTQYTRENWKRSTEITQGFVRATPHPSYGSMLLSLIKPTNISEFHTAMEMKGRGRKTRRNLHAVLATMFNHAVEREPIDRSTKPR